MFQETLVMLSLSFPKVPYLKKQDVLILWVFSCCNAEDDNMREGRKGAEYDSISHSQGQHGVCCEDDEQKKWYLEEKQGEG